MVQQNKDYGNLAKAITERVDEYFRELSKIPRGSGNEAKAAQFVIDFAKSLANKGVTFEYQTDDDPVNSKKPLHNVIIKKPATKGREKDAPIVFQAHLDMVCQKTAESTHDFTKDPIEITDYSEPGWINANGTTLGADDGIGVAVIMALFESDEADHPILEAIFTSDEEDGMSGARRFDITKIDGRRFINIDAEQEQLFFYGCAGGIATVVGIPFELTETPSDVSFYKLTVTGLHGGHSGLEIGHHYANANRLLGDTLKEVCEKLEGAMHISSASGGTAQNAIPRQSEAVIAFDAGKFECVRSIVEEKLDEFTKNEAYSDEQEITMTLEIANGDKTVDSATRDNVIGILTEIPTGVSAWYDDLDLVQTSSNMGILAYNSENKRLEISSLSRSFIGDELNKVACRIKNVAKKYNAEYMVKDSFPEWTPKFYSRLRTVFESIYMKTFGEPANTLSIHAGLECGYFAKKFQGACIETDFIAIGPTIFGAHTTEERLYWPSVPKIVELLLHVMAEIDSIDVQPEMPKALNKYNSTQHVPINCQCMK